MVFKCKLVAYEYMKLDKVGIVCKIGSQEAEAAVKTITKKLAERGSEIYTLLPVSDQKIIECHDLDELRTADLDMLVTLGGDGTTLRATRGINSEVPMLAINVGGNRGILSEITMNEFDSAISQITDSKIFLDRRVRVVATSGSKEFSAALNEIYISRATLTKTSEFEIKFQNDTVKQKMDGVIIATPSGSTGHSFSLGGPILHESLDVLIITPVAPVFGLESIVVPDERIEIKCSHDCNVVMDAQVVKPIEFGQPITITRNEKHAVFLRLKKSGLRQMIKLGF